MVLVSLFLQGEAQMNTEGRGWVGEEKERNAQHKVFTIRLCFYSVQHQTKPSRYLVGVVVLPMPYWVAKFQTSRCAFKKPGKT